MKTSFQQVAEEASRIAGAVLDEWSEKFTAREKAPADLVTEADIASQEAIHNYILQRYPDHNFLGEEGLSETNSSSPYRWVIDPLDGTSNYVHRFPYYAVSIALECEQELIAGVVYDPNRDELFSASKGNGATLNGEPISPSVRENLNEALLMASLPVGVKQDHPAVATFVRILSEAQHLQRTGSAALNLAYVAAGRIDGYWSVSLKPWDMAAGALIVTEAGGKTSKSDGTPLDIMIPNLLASNGTSLHEKIAPLL